jgi:hypothetical protein
MRSLTLAVVTFVVVGAPTTYAQSDFGGLNVAPGDVVYVIDANGVEISGPLTTVSPNVLSIGSYQFDAGKVLKIDRRGDPSWNGALVGAGVSALLSGGSVVACGRCIAPWVGFWGAIGWLIDRDHIGRTTIYRRGPTRRRSTVAPAFTDHSKGFVLAIGF